MRALVVAAAAVSALAVASPIVVTKDGLWAAAAITEPDVLFEWTSVNYTWANASQEAAYAAAGNWKVEANIITGVKAWNQRIFVSVPRWRAGVPSTLNLLTLEQTDPNGAPLLQPFPDWSWNDLSNPAGLRWVQSMEVTPAGELWVLDVGRLNVFDATAPVVNGNAKLVIFDLTGGAGGNHFRPAVKSTFVFPPDIADPTASFLNDLVVDVTARVAYISDAGTGGLVVYDGVANTARRFADASTAADLSTNITINGVWYPSFTTPTDGIALSPDRATLYYCSLRGSTLFSLPTAALRDFSLTNAQLSAQVATVGAKPPSDGMTFDSSGVLHFGSLTGDAVLSWDTSLPFAQAALEAQNATTLTWPDTFGFLTLPSPGSDPVTLLLVSTNRLCLYFTYTMDFTGAAGPNMRLLALPLPAADASGLPVGSYMQNMPPFPGGGGGGGGGGDTLQGFSAAAQAAVGVLAGALVLALAALAVLWTRGGVAAAFAPKRSGGGAKAEVTMETRLL